MIGHLVRAIEVAFRKEPADRWQSVIKEDKSAMDVRGQLSPEGLPPPPPIEEPDEAEAVSRTLSGR